MSADKNPSIFLRQKVAFALIILSILFETCAILKIGEYHSDIPQFLAGDIQSHDAF